ncbi:MAG: CHAP domain-containing protein [Ruminococcus sp.]|nr:CHAP domain-containing protein [Ruminococcus sp.]
MKTSIIKKAIAGITAALTLGTASAVLAPVSSFAANGTAQEACSIASNYLKNPGSYSHSSSAWCAEFAVDCIKEAGVNMTGLASYSTNTLLTNFYNKDHSSYHSRSGSAWRSAYPNPNTRIDTNYTPQPGDLAFVQNNWYDPEPDHTALVVSVSGTGINATVTTIEGNMSGTIKSMTYTGGEIYGGYRASIYGYATPKYTKTSNFTKLAGDLDLNGRVDTTDCTYLSLYLLGDKSLASIAGNEAATRANADVNGDGTINIVDLTTLKQIVSKKDSAEINVNYTVSLSGGTTLYNAAGGSSCGTVPATGVYTIIKEQYKNGIKYGYLKSGAGWVKL